MICSSCRTPETPAYMTNYEVGEKIRLLVEANNRLKPFFCEELCLQDISNLSWENVEYIVSNWSGLRTLSICGKNALEKTTREEKMRVTDTSQTDSGSDFLPRVLNEKQSLPHVLPIYNSFIPGDTDQRVTHVYHREKELVLEFPHRRR